MPQPEQLNGHRPSEIEILSHRLPDRIVIEVIGEVDLATAATLERELVSAEESHDVVALDLRQTSFMDSTGVHMLIAADRRLRERGGCLVVVQGPPQIRRLLELTHVAEHLVLVDDQAEVEHATEACG